MKMRHAGQFAIAILVALSLTAGALVVEPRLVSGSGSGDQICVAEQEDATPEHSNANTTTDPHEKDADDEDCEAPVAPGTLTKGNGLLPQAAVTLDQAISIAQSKVSGTIGEVKLKNKHGLQYTVDIGQSEVKIDATSGAVLSVAAED